MRDYYKILDALKDYLQQNPNVNTINVGDLFSVDLSKETVFPLVNIDVVSVEFLDHVSRFNIRFIAADIVDETLRNKKDEKNVYHGADNLQDIYNTQLTVINLLQSVLKRGDIGNVDYIIDNEQVYVATPFEQRFENLLAGWTLDLAVDIPNDDVSIC